MTRQWFLALERLAEELCDVQWENKEPFCYLFWSSKKGAPKWLLFKLSCMWLNPFFDAYWWFPEGNTYPCLLGLQTDHFLLFLFWLWVSIALRPPCSCPSVKLIKPDLNTVTYTGKWWLGSTWRKGRASWLKCLCCPQQKTPTMKVLHMEKSCQLFHRKDHSLVLSPLEQNAEKPGEVSCLFVHWAWFKNGRQSLNL